MLINQFLWAVKILKKRHDLEAMGMGPFNHQSFLKRDEMAETLCEGREGLCHSMLAQSHCYAEAMICSSVGYDHSNV